MERAILFPISCRDTLFKHPLLLLRFGWGEDIITARTRFILPTGAELVCSVMTCEREQSTPVPANTSHICGLLDEWLPFAVTRMERP